MDYDYNYNGIKIRITFMMLLKKLRNENLHMEHLLVVYLKKKNILICTSHPENHVLLKLRRKWLTAWHFFHTFSQANQLQPVVVRLVGKWQRPEDKNFFLLWATTAGLLTTH